MAVRFRPGIPNRILFEVNIIMKLMCKILRMDPESREGIIQGTSFLGILVNLLVASVKVILGLLASSMAIISEGINNASDALTSVLTLIGSKLAGKKPDAKHPFGYGRIEYLTGLVIAVLILITGVEMIKSSIELIFNPKEMDISTVAIIAVAISAVIKFVLGVYTIKMGNKADSETLKAVGLDCRNDSFISLVTIASAVIFIVFKISIDAYVGIFMSLLVIKIGVEVLIDTIGELIGRPGEEELAKKLYKEIRSEEIILNAADMMLHNYGPERYSGSVNVEIDHEKTVEEVYERLHALQLHIMHEYNVTMVFGIYAVDNDHEEVKKIRRSVGSFVKSHDHITNFHAIYLEPATNKLYCDLVVDYNLKDWDNLREEFTKYMKELYPNNELVLTIETEFV